MHCLFIRILYMKGTGEDCGFPPLPQKRGKGGAPVDGQEVVPLGNEDAEGFPVCRAMQKTAHKPAPWKYLLVISTFAPPRLLLLAYVSKKGTTS
jgi:hypothetical protein